MRKHATTGGRFSCPERSPVLAEFQISTEYLRSTGNRLLIDDRITCSRMRPRCKSRRNHFDVRAVTWRSAERRVAGDDRRIERFGQGNVHGVVHRDVLAQLPRASQEVEMGVTVEIEVGEIRHRVGRSVR